MLKTAHKTELARFTGGNLVGVDLKEKRRLTLLNDLLALGYVKRSQAYAGYQYFERTTKQF